MNLNIDASVQEAAAARLETLFAEEANAASPAEGDVQAAAEGEAVGGDPDQVPADTAGEADATTVTETPTDEQVAAEAEAPETVVPEPAKGGVEFDAFKAEVTQALAQRDTVIADLTSKLGQLLEALSAPDEPAQAQAAEGDADSEALKKLLEAVGEDGSADSETTAMIRALAKKVEAGESARAEEKAVAERQSAVESEGKRIDAEVTRVRGLYPDVSDQTLYQAVVYAARMGAEDPVAAIPIIAKNLHDQRKALEAEIRASIVKETQPAKAAPAAKPAAATPNDVAEAVTTAAKKPDVPRRPATTGAPVSTLSAAKAERPTNPKDALKWAHEQARRALDAAH